MRGRLAQNETTTVKELQLAPLLIKLSILLNYKYMANTGVIKPEIKPTDWKVGAESGIPYKEVCDDWTPYLPVYEPQIGTYVATQACVTFSALNCIETQLKQQGIDINFSDRFTAKMSGTTMTGNTLQNVLDSFRKNGWLLEEDYPFDKSREGRINWDEFYKEIPQELKDKAKKNKDNANWQVNYEWFSVNNCYPDLEAVRVQLKQAPLQRATSYGSGVCNFEHATMVYKIDRNYIYIYDSYEGGIVKNQLTYAMPALMKIVVGPKTVEPNLIPPITKDLRYGMRNDAEVKYLQQKLIKIGYLSKGLDTGNYLNLTTAAVKTFQWDYKVASIPILLWNKGKLVASATRAKLNSL